MSTEFTVEEKKDLLSLARRTIRQYLQKGKKIYTESGNKKLQENRGVFVTLHIEGNLRGCIGYPLPIKPLYIAVADNAVSAAVDDPRFSSLTSEELEKADIEISILTVPREVKSPEEVVVGRDGIIITKGFNRGLLLPQVPVEQNWDLDEYISYGCLKAGLPSDEWKKGVKIETFQAIVFGEKELE